MWCGFTKYEGIRYVSWLSNSPKEHGAVLLTSDGDSAPECLLVAENNLGITKLSLANFCDKVVEERPGTWWRTIRLDSRGMNVDVETDGVKLRWLARGKLGRVAWNVPEPKKPRFHYFTNGVMHPVPDRMASFLANHPEATGYSFVWDCGLVYIHAHIAGEGLACYRSFPHGSRLYMPVDSDEFITEIWQRKGYLPREWAIGFVTNKDRIFVAGAYLKAGQRPYHLIERPSRQLSRVYFETSADGIGALAFATDVPKVENPSFVCPQPSPNRVSPATV
ncbi:hypothetical protein HRG_013885 [Hirsutella rhossiliensis]